jgi:hypothetical protein
VVDLQHAIAFPDVRSNRTRRIQDAFKVVPVGTDALQFNYTDSFALNFTADRRNRPSALRQAALRRECRGLVVHRDGAVLVRPFHRFFSIGQTIATQIGRLAGTRSGVVTRKLDGQMVCGVVVGGMVQLWSRAGPTKTGVEAFRVTIAAQADYSGFVKFASEQQSTPIFEYVGKRSHKKAYEGGFHRIILLAVRFHSSGEYWLDEEMRSVAAGFGVPVVQRLHHLEGLEIQELQKEVAGWQNCEGVVTRLLDGSWLKVKSDWWKKSGYSSSFTARIANRVEQVKRGVSDNISRGQHHLVRVAVKGLAQDIRVPEVVALFPACCKVEVVYKHNGRLSLVVVTFRTVAQRNATLKAYNGNERVQVQPAYSCRTRDSDRARVCTHQILPRVWQQTRVDSTQQHQPTTGMDQRQQQQSVGDNGGQQQQPLTRAQQQQQQQQLQQPVGDGSDQQQQQQQAPTVTQQQQQQSIEDSDGQQQQQQQPVAATCS